MLLGKEVLDDLVNQVAIESARLFDARRAKDAAIDAQYAENLKVKEALAAKAEALLPVKDVRSAKKALRP
ncbi:MAG: DUF349 domain-containing protein, partial [Tannerella sp.]